MSWLKTIGHCAVLIAILWVCDQFGARIEASTFAICVGIAALQRTYVRSGQEEAGHRSAR